jgi:hypothetical protein
LNACVELLAQFDPSAEWLERADEIQMPKKFEKGEMLSRDRFASASAKTIGNGLDDDLRIGNSMIFAPSRKELAPRQIATAFEKSCAMVSASSSLPNIANHHKHT